MKIYKALLIGSVLGTISMPAVMADVYNNVNLGMDNTIVANTNKIIDPNGFSPKI